MNDTWTPISVQEIQAKIDTAVDKMSPKERVLWGYLRVVPQKWSLSPWGDEGGGFWVVAIGGDICIYYNDIEDGFNVSGFSQLGEINSYYCDQDELQWIIHRMMDAIDAASQ